ncbi:hypothetical protein WISP_145572 [Willisornis vidua]|uniref:Uncharacterized protein n=1 Tax=Willisornis vidua TaxID=1566151 RepID=A0ABQ9CQP7_9PASS|nr:hypothetical protein WISP_145572 [Willisornis vidua]
MEKIILGHIEKHVKDKAVISHSQHSLMRGKSCLSTLTSSYDKVLSLEWRVQVQTQTASCPDGQGLGEAAMAEQLAMWWMDAFLSALFQGNITRETRDARGRNGVRVIDAFAVS